MSNLKRNFCKKSDHIDEAWDEEWRAETVKNLAGMAICVIVIGLMFLWILHKR